MRPPNVRLPVSSDGGKTWKKRWVCRVTGIQLNEGDLVRVGDKIHKTIIVDGKLRYPPIERVEVLENASSDTGSSSQHKPHVREQGDAVSG